MRFCQVCAFRLTMFPHLEGCPEAEACEANSSELKGQSGGSNSGGSIEAAAMCAAVRA